MLLLACQRRPTSGLRLSSEIEIWRELAPRLARRAYASALLRWMGAYADDDGRGALERLLAASPLPSWWGGGANLAHGVTTGSAMLWLAECDVRLADADAHNGGDAHSGGGETTGGSSSSSLALLLALAGLWRECEAYLDRLLSSREPLHLYLAAEALRRRGEPARAAALYLDAMRATGCTEPAAAAAAAVDELGGGGVVSEAPWAAPPVALRRLLSAVRAVRGLAPLRVEHPGAAVGDALRQWHLYEYLSAVCGSLDEGGHSAEIIPLAAATLRLPALAACSPRASAGVHTLLFKHALALGHYRNAHTALLGLDEMLRAARDAHAAARVAPAAEATRAAVRLFEERRSDCLRTTVSQLYERGCMPLLAELPWEGELHEQLQVSTTRPLLLLPHPPHP